MNESVEIRVVDYRDPQQMRHLFSLLNEYASEPLGGGEPLPESRLKELQSGLRDFPLAFSLIAYAGDQPVGLANCFYGFSTFAARKLINLHDLMVTRDYRGRGISHRLLDEIERIARDNDCVKITLEVLSENEVAKQSYLKFGFRAYELDSDGGEALFWQKKLN